MDPIKCYDLYGFCLSKEINLSLFVTVLIFLAGFFINSYIDRKKKRQARKSFIKALSEEIKLNVSSLRKADNGLPSNSDINEFMAKSKDNRPFLTFSYFSVIYSSRTEILQDLPDILVRNIVEFYGKLNDLSIDVAAVDKDAFSKISDHGRQEIIYDIVSQLKIVLQQGQSISDSIELQLLPDRMF